MKRKDIIAVLIIAAAAAALLIYGLSSRTAVRAPGGPQPATEPAESPAAEPAPVPTLNPAQSYLRITTANGAYAPIPLVEEGTFTLTQDDAENVVHVGKDSFYMESANCEGHDCVKQGEVTLENRDERVLYNMIICLPHQVTLELLTPEEAQTAFQDMYGDGAAQAGEVEDAAQ